MISLIKSRKTQALRHAVEKGRLVSDWASGKLEQF